jgi:hypothetical protein
METFMKTNFVRSLTLVLISFICQFALAGNSGGGGNLKPGKPVSTQTVKQYLEKIQIPVELSFKYLSVARFNNQGYFGTEGAAGATDIGKLIYVNKPDIFAKIRTVKPTVVTDGSCKINGVSNDGASYTNPDRICLDAARISANSKVGDEDMELVTNALAAHEYSHLVGTSEDQANFVQDMVQEYISPKLAKNYSNFLYTLNNRLDYGIQLLQAVQTDLQNKVDWSQVCMDVTSAVDIVAQTTTDAHDNNNGIGFFSRKEYDQTMPFFRSASTIEFACKNDAATIQLRNYVWGSAKAISDAEYIHRRFPKSSGNILTNSVVERMDYQNPQALGVVVEKLIGAVNLLKTYLPSVK